MASTGQTGSDEFDWAGEAKRCLRKNKPVFDRLAEI